MGWRFIADRLIRLVGMLYGFPYDVNGEEKFDLMSQNDGECLRGIIFVERLPVKRRESDRARGVMEGMVLVVFALKEFGSEGKVVACDKKCEESPGERPGGVRRH